MQNKNKILIIEDDEVLQSSLYEIISMSGYEAIIAKDGTGGYNLAIREQPFLILLDLNLPHMYGLTILEKIRTECGTWGRDVAIIIITNQDPDNKILDSLEKYNPSYYLLKSNLNLADLMSNIKLCER